jgi:hypothetical protein
MSKFLLNLLLQISKALIYSKNQIVIRKIIFSSLSAQSAQRPAGPSGLSAQPWPIFFSFQLVIPPPSPHWASASRPTQPALSAQSTTRGWRPGRLPPPSWENASPHAAFAPLRAWMIGGPHLSSPSSGVTRAPLRAAAS